MNKNCIIITTINEKNESLEKFSNISGYDLIIVGDVKSPKYYDLDCTYLDLSEQNKLFPTLSKLLPINHYSRKNLGYLYAANKGYVVIGESDDDNIPYNNWNIEPCTNNVVTSEDCEINIYGLYTTKKIWPRGYNIEKINSVDSIKIRSDLKKVAVWQSLVDGDPDVDAIYRLTTIADDNFMFDKNGAFVLDTNIFTPFNTQNTKWVEPSFFSYMYLPCFVNFRFTDILRSYIAQFTFWGSGYHLGVNESTVVQVRNAHNYMNDFKDELTMYTTYKLVYNILKNSTIRDKKDFYDLYTVLSENNIIDKRELIVIKEWLNYF